MIRSANFICLVWFSLLGDRFAAKMHTPHIKCVKNLANTLGQGACLLRIVHKFEQLEAFLRRLDTMQASTMPLKTLIGTQDLVQFGFYMV